MKKLLTIFAALLPLLAAARVHSGVEVLRNGGFEPLQGKRVGLVTNPTGVDADLVSTVDILHSAPGVTLAALFAPEHGVRGDVPAGAKVASATDPATGVKVFSLYGATKKPTAAMMRGLDVMVYDLQDIGCRSYTFISTLSRVMQACVEHDVPLLVLDRPNPLGGLRVEGPMGVEADCRSFVSELDIPYIYGLTVGELARYLNATDFGGKCRLDVVPMQGWTRDMTFDATGLPWVPTSPNIPTADTPLYYPATGILGELGVCSIGANFTLPFKLAVSASVDAAEFARSLNSYDLQGVRFRPYYVTIGGKRMQGVQVMITDAARAQLTPVQFFIMQALDEQGIDALGGAAPSRVDMFNKVCGSKAVAREFSKRRKAADVLPLLIGDTAPWRAAVAPFLLYD